MNELQIFENPDFGQIRTVEVNGEPWLVGRDVAAALGYSNPQKAIRDHVDSDDCTVNDSFTVNGTQGTLINESGLYALVLSSKLPGAKRFKRWVTSEVLPAVRRTGGYLAGAERMTPEELMAKALTVAQRTLADREARLSALAVENQIMQPKAEYFDQLVERNTLTNLRETAKQLGVPPKQLVDSLLGHKYLYRDKRGKLLPYEDRNKGLFEVKECYNEKTKWSGTQTLVTPKGRETFRLLYL